MLSTTTIQRLLILAILLCITTAIITYRGYREKAAAQRWVEHTYQVIEKALRVVDNFQSAETNQRAFLTIGDQAFVQKHRALALQVIQDLEKITEFVSDNDDQQQRLTAQVLPLVKNRFSEINELISHRPETINLAKTLAQSVRAQTNLDSVLNPVIKQEEVLLKDRNERLASVSFFYERVLYLSVLLIAVTIVLAYATIQKFQKQNRQLVNSLERSNENLESKVHEQTKEIRTAYEAIQAHNADLNALNEELRSSEENVRANLDYIQTLKIELEKSELLHRTLSENSTDIIALFDLDNKFTYVSPAVKKILGYEPTKLIGQTGSSLVHPDDLKILTDPRSIALEGNIPHSATQFRLRRRDGEYVWMEAQSITLFDREGHPISIQTISRDITDRKAAETDLREAKEKAEEATLAKSQFLSTMSHEIRTPMNAVIGLTTILLQTHPRPDQEESLKLLKFSGENLLTIINDILDFSKIEANKITLEKINFNVHELFDRIKRVQETRANEKNLDLRLRFEPGVPTILLGDPVRINQIVTNLVSNALKFTEQGHVEIAVGSAIESPDMHRLSVAIKDTGIGVDKDKLNLIFERFSQAHSDTTRKFGGTGLGLAITKHLVEMMGGTISVNSTPGSGSEFHFNILLEKGDEHHEALPAEKVSDDQEDIKAHVLLVEDNRINQIVAEKFLTAWGVDVTFANNGMQALKLIDSRTYDLVLMDLEMPEMDGYTAALKIRALDEQYFKTVPIIALTASAMIDIKDRALKSGMNDYISKPFDPATLRTKIASFVKKKISEEHVAAFYGNTFELYTQGHPDFKKELGDLIVKNIQDLMASIDGLKAAEGPAQFHSAVHKAKTAMKFLGDYEFENLTADIQRKLRAGQNLDGELSTFKAYGLKLIQGIQENIREL